MSDGATATSGAAWCGTAETGGWGSKRAGTTAFARTAGGRGVGAFAGPSAGSSGSLAGGTFAGADDTGRTAPEGGCSRREGGGSVGWYEADGSRGSFTVHSR
ncbi:hypothetical protein ACFXA2_29875 [Micromonospora chalcea]